MIRSCIGFHIWKVYKPGLFRVQAPLSSESPISALFCVLFLCSWYQRSYHGTTTTPSITQSIRVTVPESSRNSQKSLWLDWLKLHTHPQINPVVRAIKRVIFSTLSLCLWNHIRTKGGVEWMVKQPLRHPLWRANVTEGREGQRRVWQ